MNKQKSSGNTAQSSLADDIKKMTEAELIKKIGELAVAGEDFSEYKKELDIKKNKPQTNTEDNEKEISKILEKKTLRKEDKEKLKKLILEEIKNHKQSSADTQKQVEDKESEIQRLMYDLGQEKYANNQILTDTPSLTEYFSIERKRSAKMLKKFSKFKSSDKKNYPKNLIIYAMGITNSKLFGTRQMLKRGWASIAWKWKEDDIKNNLKIILDKTKSNPNDSKWKAAIKKALYEEIKIAVEEHKNKLIKQNSLDNYK